MFVAGGRVLVRFRRGGSLGSRQNGVRKDRRLNETRMEGLVLGCLLRRKAQVAERCWLEVKDGLAAFVISQGMESCEKDDGRNCR